MTQYSFLPYLSGQKRMIFIAAGISAICFLLLKVLFPYPDLYVDSTNYVFWAVNKFDVAYRPTTYSDFLRWAHSVAPGATFTVFIQYLLFFLSSMFCFLSADFLLVIPGKLKWPLLLAILLCPLPLLQTNLISSDSLFCSATVTWFTLCLWVVSRHTWWVLILQALLLVLCFELRYAAMFFPVVAIVAFICSSSSLPYKAIGILLTVSVIFFCVDRQTKLNKEATDTEIFSGFSGWQIANNALYCYKHVDVDNNDLPSVQLQTLDKIVKRYIDTVGVQDGELGSSYIWHNLSPLKMYCRLVEHKNKILYSSAWFSISPMLDEYGWYIIRHFPGAYVKYYILPNTVKFFYPDREALVNYNSDNLTLPEETKKWFEMDINKLECKLPGLQKGIISMFPAISMLLNLFNIGALFVFCNRHRKVWGKVNREIKVMFITWAAFYCCFMVFSILASPVNLRFMDPIFVLGVIMPVILLGYSVKQEEVKA
ncbi:MAG: hypothetical protein JWQ38_1315 [Flavipsychrobacter sp.]|nr:hypothetical protein [Flavipsychrobacter sp.]